MAITSTNRTSIGYVKEATEGVTPNNPRFQLLPTTGGSPMSETSTEVSNVIRSDRMVDDLVPVDENISGEIEFELSHDAYKPLITSLLRTNASTGRITANDIAVNQANRTFTTTAGNFQTSKIVPGCFVNIVGYANPLNNGVKFVESVTAKTMVVAGPVATEGAGRGVTISNSGHVLNGESNVDTYSFIKRVEGISKTAYFYYKGIEINSMSFNLEVGSLLTGSMGLIGRNETISEAQLAGSAYLQPAAYTIMNAVTSVSNVSLTGIEDVVNYSSLSLTITNNIEGAKAIGTLGAVDLAAFTCEVTGEISVYFESKSIYDSYKAAESFSLRLVLKDGDGNHIGIHMPKCKFETLETPIDGKDSFFMCNGTFRALRDSGQNKQISVTFMDV